MSRILTRRFLFIVIGLAVVAILIVAFSSAITEDPEAWPGGTSDPAVLSIFSGETSFLTEGETEWTEASDGMCLRAGDRVRTEADSYALITFLDGSTIEIDPETDISVVKVDSTEKGSTTVRLKQWLGRSWSRVERLVDAKSSYEVDTPSAVATVRGTLFDLEVKPDATTITRVFEGEVGVTGREQEVLLGAGKEAYVRDGQSPSQPLSIAPPSSQLRVSIASSALLQLIDPLGRSAGVVPPGLEVNQIPRATTAGSLGKPQVVELNDAAGGEYAIILYAQEDGAVSLEMEGISQDIVKFEESRTLEVEKGQNYRIPLQVGMDQGLITQLELGQMETFTEDVAGKIVIMESVLEREAELYADFATDDTVVTAGRVVQFSDLSSGDDSLWSWDFGDGHSSTEQNPEHIYTSAAAYSVSLVVSNADGSHKETKYVIVYSQPKADFEVEPTETPVGQDIWFKDRSAGNPSEWLWDFGDGETSDERYPSHCYGSAGTYTVSLTVSNPAGSDMVAKKLNVGVLDTYTLNVAVSGNGSTTPVAGDHNYAEGTEVGITATPDSGWQFNGWTGDVADSNSASTTVTMDSNKKVTANFSEIPPDVQTYTLTVAVSGNGSTTPMVGDHNYAEGTEVGIIAAPDSGWQFDGWTGDFPEGAVADVNATQTTITMNDDYSITANFEAIPHYLTLSSGSHGTVTTPGEGTFGPYTYGQVVSLAADADSGYAFDDWTGNTGTIADSGDATTTITMYGDYFITANFEAIPYYLTVSSGSHGSVTTPGEGTFGPYTYGQVVSLAADADSGYAFDDWTGNTETIADSGDATTTITMYGDYSIMANFYQMEYYLTIDTEVPPHGSVILPGEGTFGPYTHGQVVTLWASPYSGCTFDQWTGSTGTIADRYDATTTITMYGDYSITANFEPVYYLTISSTPGGHVEVPGEGTFGPYTYGQVVSLEAVKDVPSWWWDEWTGDIGTIADPYDATTTITMYGSYSVTANFQMP